MNKELIITKEDIELLKEMKENCLKSGVYDDEKRLLKANAITKFLNLLDTDKKQKEVIDKVIKILNECKLLMPHEFDWEEQVNNALDTLNEVQNEKN